MVWELLGEGELVHHQKVVDAMEVVRKVVHREVEEEAYKIAVEKVLHGDQELALHQMAVDVMEVDRPDLVKDNKEALLLLDVKAWVRPGDQELVHHQKAVTMVQVAAWVKVQHQEDHLDAPQVEAEWEEETLLELHRELHFLEL